MIRRLRMFLSRLLYKPGGAELTVVYPVADDKFSKSHLKFEDGVDVINNGEADPVLSIWCDGSGWYVQLMPTKKSQDAN